MARHFLQLYLLIVLTLAAASWMQDWLWDTYTRRGAAEAAFQDRAQAATLAVVAEQLRAVPRGDRQRFVAELAAGSGVDLELFEPHDIAGGETFERLAQGAATTLNATDGRTWMLRGLEDDGRVLAFRYAAPDAQPDALEWALALILYGAIALVIMTWLWPLTRDLRRLERATMSFGDRNWTFDAEVRPGSQVHRLAEAFRRMAARIDALIGSHKEMSNAVAHEIKTPLARMRFEIEMARTATGPQQLEHLNNINSDIVELNGFVAAALDYAILERAEVALNAAEHDFTLILPALTESASRSAPPGLEIRCEVADNATAVSCDAHLMETVLRNLLYNAIRYARKDIRVTFALAAGKYSLRVEDDGPGIPEADRQRVFDSFVQLGERGAHKTGYGLGLAIVRRVVEWHGGEVAVSQSDLGGAAFAVRWPI